MKFNAQLNDDSIVIGISQTTEAINEAGYLQIPNYDESLIGKRWDGHSFVAVPEPEPETTYKTLKKIGFIRLLQSSGGTTQQQVLDAKSDPALAYFWLMFDMATEFERSDPEIDEGLDALVSLGYLPLGKQAVLDAWPSE